MSNTKGFSYVLKQHHYIGWCKPQESLQWHFTDLSPWPCPWLGFGQKFRWRHDWKILMYVKVSEKQMKQAGRNEWNEYLEWNLAVT